MRPIKELNFINKLSRLPRGTLPSGIVENDSGGALAVLIHPSCARNLGAAALTCYLTLRLESLDGAHVHGIRGSLDGSIATGAPWTTSSKRVLLLMGRILVLAGTGKARLVDSELDRVRFGPCAQVVHSCLEALPPRMEMHTS